MKLIIAGGRGYRFTEDDKRFLDSMIHNPGIEEVVSGCCSGADKCGEDWAESRGIPVKRFPAQWHLYGAKAGPRRNKEMAAHADAVALFPGGPGTENVAIWAKRNGLMLYDRR